MARTQPKPFVSINIRAKTRQRELDMLMMTLETVSSILTEDH